LYVSQHTTTLTAAALLIIATLAVPAREYSAPFEKRAFVPRRTSEARGRREGREERRA
jgi:hypothetical protein